MLRAIPAPMVPVPRTATMGELMSEGHYVGTAHGHVSYSGNGNNKVCTVG